MDTILIIAGILIVLVFIGWLGLKQKPAPYPPFQQPQQKQPKLLPIPEGLPEPVERFYRVTYGDQIPHLMTVVLSGRGWMAPFGVRIPMRFRFIYDAGRDYRAMFAGTFFGKAWMKADETYIDGHAIGKMPTGVDEGAWFDDAMNVRIYCEILHWFPAALLTTPGVCWEPVDDDMALLVLPFGKKQQRVVVRFDPASGKVAYFEAMKYRNAKTRMLWINGIWFDQRREWILMEVEDTVYNAPVHEAITAKAG